MTIATSLARQIGATLAIEAADQGTRVVVMVGALGEPASHALMTTGDAPLAA